MTTDQKTPGQVLYEAGSKFFGRWVNLDQSMREEYESFAAAVIAHDRANQPAASGVTDTQRLDWIIANETSYLDRADIDAAMAAAPEAPKP